MQNNGAFYSRREKKYYDIWLFSILRAFCRKDVQDEWMVRYISSVQFSRSLMTIVTIYCIFCLQSYQKFLLWLYRQRRIRESIWTWWLHRNFLNRWGNRQDHLSLADKHTFCIKSISQSMWRRGHQRPQNHRIYLEKGNKGGTNLYLQLPHPTSGVAPEQNQSPAAFSADEITAFPNSHNTNYCN